MFLRHPLPLLTREVPAIALDPATTALLLQDVHAPFADGEGGWLIERAQRKVVAREFDFYFDALDLVASNITRCLSLCRAAGFTVLYSCLGYRPPDQPSVFQSATGWAWRLDDEDGRFPAAWAPVAGETVFAKPGWGALANPALAALLAERGIASVVVVGCMLEYGIRQTCTELADRGIQPLVISDAVVPLTEMGQRYTTGSMAHGLVKLRPTGEFAALLARLPAEGAVPV